MLSLLSKQPYSNFPYTVVGKNEQHEPHYLKPGRTHTTRAVLDLDKERSYAIPLMRPLPIPHLHKWKKMEVSY
jgi:hypothetical protein